MFGWFDYMAIVKRWMYAFNDPFGNGDIKVGITSNPRMRLGVYQCAYSARSHRACFDFVWEGPSAQIEKLEKELKLKYDWQIENDSLGESEWITDTTLEEIIDMVNELIKGWRLHVAPLDFQFPIKQVDVDYKIGNETWRTKND